MEQAELIPLELLPDTYSRPEDPTGRSTGERVERDRPQLYASIVAALGEGFGIRQSARAFRIHRDTVAAIRDRESARIGPLKQATARNLRRFAAIASERMLEEVDTLSPLQLAIATGIAIDKSQLLEGQATSITEHRSADKRIEDLDTVIAELEEPVPATGLPGGTGGQKGIGLPEPMPALRGSDMEMSEAGASGGDQADADVQSVGKHQ